MYDKLPEELNWHVLSFLSNRELASQATVCKAANSSITEVLKTRMNNFSLGREHFKSLCMANPMLAKIGVDIDSARTRYHLLVNDICDIALINEDVAKYVIHNVKLQSTRRLSKELFVKICKTFPALAPELFSCGVQLPERDQLVQIITDNPNMFDILFSQSRFIGFINNIEILEKLSLINESIALKIYNNSEKFSDFDHMYFLEFVANNYKSITLAILENPKYFDLLYNDPLLKYGKKYVEAAKIIIGNSELSSKLDAKEKGILEEIIEASETSLLKIAKP